MVHDVRCPAHEVEKWANVEKCGPCDWLAWQDAKSLTT